MQVVWEASQKRQMAHIVEQRTENIGVDVFSTSTHVDKPKILLQISNVDLVFELDTEAVVSLVGPDVWNATSLCPTMGAIRRYH